MSKVIILLHEIYGVNQFIQEKGQEFEAAGYDVICPDLLNRKAFSYEECNAAYDYYMKFAGFESYTKINELMISLKNRYEKVFVAGFSAGATIAYRCSENELCDGVIGCYGSRIRDYTNVAPVCPTLLLFANEASFDVDGLIEKLRKNPQVEVHKLNADHGFMDPYSKHYNESETFQAKKWISEFLQKYNA